MTKFGRESIVGLGGKTASPRTCFSIEARAKYKPIVVASARVGLILLCRLPGHVEGRQDVVHDTRISRLEFDGFDPFPLAQSRWQYEHSELVAAVGLDSERLRNGVDHVGRTEIQSESNWHSGGASRGVAFRTTGLVPGEQSRDLGVGKHPGITERIALSRGGGPGRHAVIGREARDVGGPFSRLLVDQERERCNLARPVAVLAMLLKNRSDIAVIRRRRAPCSHATGQAPQEHEKCHPSNRSIE